MPPKKKDYIKCDCGCTIFEQVKIQRFEDSQSVILGQPLLPDDDEFIFLRCAKCNKLREPKLVRQFNAQKDKDYENLYKELFDELKVENV